MADKIQCETHGESLAAYVCSHLSGGSAGLGFNRNEPTENNPYPDAWCDDCEIIRAAHDGWNEKSEKLTKISLLCSGCYERARIRNTRTAVTLDDLANLKWKCTSCEEWHTGPCLDFSYGAPYYWTKEHEEESRRAGLHPKLGKGYPKTFLDEDFCVIDGKDFFVRGLIHLPILGTAETLCWGVWGSLSRKNFEMLWDLRGDRQESLPAMFSWLSTQIPEYPDTLNLKMYAHVQTSDERPHFELEPADHPLSQEFHNGITPERVKEIMLGRLRDAETQ
jgi:hypothetical protein